MRAEIFTTSSTGVRIGWVLSSAMSPAKAMASALVRANLQASLRTVCKLGVDDFEQSLALVNRLLFESTPEAMYATLFFAEYDENSRRFATSTAVIPRLCSMVATGVSRLNTTSPVLGLFSDWKGSIDEVAA